MEECSLDFLYLGRLEQLSFWWRKAVFFEQLKLYYFRQSKNIYFVITKSLTMLLGPIRKFNFSPIKFAYI